MAIIENYLTNRFYRYQTNRIIKKLLKYIPKDHLLGLEKIVVFASLNRKNRNSAALYWPKNNSSQATIEISFSSVVHRKPYLIFFPFVGKFLLASALYHEIGHHHHHSFKHGVKKKKSEAFAEKYKKEILRKSL